MPSSQGCGMSNANSLGAGRRICCPGCDLTADQSFQSLLNMMTPGTVRRIRTQYSASTARLQLTPVGPQVLYLPVHFFQRPPDGRFQPRPSMVREVAGQHARLFQEHAHVPKLHEL
jgi:hypothetical protein